MDWPTGARHYLVKYKEGEVRWQRYRHGDIGPHEKKYFYTYILGQNVNFTNMCTIFKLFTITACFGTKGNIRN